jgi:ribosomal protein S25
MRACQRFVPRISKKRKKKFIFVIDQNDKKNKPFTLTTRIRKEIDTEKYIKLLQAGDLYEFEESLHRFILQEVYNI